MRKFARPALITLCAAAIVFAAALFAASRSSKTDYQSTSNVEFVHVNKSVPALDDIALKGSGRGAPMRLAAPSAIAVPASKSGRNAPQIARVGSVSLFVQNVDKAVS